MRLQRPSPGAITSKFGRRDTGIPGASTNHLGVDFGWGNGWTISAAADGHVVFAGRAGGYGNLTKIRHRDGTETWYAHASEIYVRPGQYVTAGLAIAKIGDTGIGHGPHLHFEYRISGTPVDPVPYFTAPAGKPITPIAPSGPKEEDDMYDAQAQQALFAKLDELGARIERDARPLRAYQLDSGIILIGPGGKQWIVPSMAYMQLVQALGLAGGIQRIINGAELEFMKFLLERVAPDPANIAQVDRVLELSNDDAARIAAQISTQPVTLTPDQLQQITDAARTGSADAVKQLSFVTVAQ